MTKQIVGYARANDERDLSQFITQLTEAGCSAVFTDCIGGNTVYRPGLNEALAKLGTGDTLVVPSADRLARSIETHLQITDQIQRRGIELVLLDQVTKTPA